MAPSFPVEKGYGSAAHRCGSGHMKRWRRQKLKDKIIKTKKWQLLQIQKEPEMSASMAAI
jgi:hypothetical protein